VVEVLTIFKVFDLLPFSWSLRTLKTSKLNGQVYLTQEGIFLEMTSWKACIYQVRPYFL